MVVIAIIGLLASILFPVFARARENARRATCQSNEKQLGLAFIQYTQDYDEQYPQGLYSAPNGTGCGWGAQVYPYVKNPDVYACPDDTSPTASLYTGLGAIWYKVSYAYNSSIPYPYNDWHVYRGNVASLTSSAKTVLLCETAATGGTITAGTEASQFHISPATSGVPVGMGCITIPTEGSNEAGLYATGFMAQRGGTATAMITSVGANPGEFLNGTGIHMDGSNFLMADGHVKWLIGDFVSTGSANTSSTGAQGTGDTCGQNNDDTTPNKPLAEGTGYSGPGAHEVTFSPT